MSRSYTIADARHNLAAIVHELEREPAIQLTRRGHPVAVLLSMSEHARLQGGSTTFGDTYQAFCASVDLAALDIDLAVFDGVCDLTSGHEMSW